MDFKGKAKAFVRTYGFLAAILPYTNAEWEKLSIFLNFLIPKLPAPQEEDLSKGILEAIDMDSYRVEKSGRNRRSRCRTRTPRSSPCRPAAAAPSLSRNWIDSEQHHQGVQRSVRQHRLEGRRQDPAGDRRGDPREGRGGQGVPERAKELRQAERPHRARQGPGARHDGPAHGPHRALQAVQRQPLLQEVAGRHDLLVYVQRWSVSMAVRANAGRPPHEPKSSVSWNCFGG